MIYIDPPFNTGKVQQRKLISVVAADFDKGDRTGFGGKRYDTTTIDSPKYEDKFDDFEGFLMPRIEKSLHCLTSNGSLFVHLDFREVHYIKVALDKLLGRDHFMNEIIWAYDYGGRSKKRNGLQNTIIFCGMQLILKTTYSIMMLWREYLIWLRG